MDIMGYYGYGTRHGVVLGLIVASEESLIILFIVVVVEVVVVLNMSWPLLH